MKKCFRCCTRLKAERDKELKKEYPYYCPECNENMYSFEAVDGSVKNLPVAAKICEMRENVRRFICSLQKQKCGKCPAYYKDDIIYGDYLEGCSLNKSCYGFCIDAFLPRMIVRIKLAIMDRYEKKHFSAAYTGYLGTGAVLEPRD